MQTIIEYIMLNYTWFIAGSIIILLAIIGYYADKTNFGQGKPKDNINKDESYQEALEGKRMEDLFVESNDESIVLDESTQAQTISSDSNIPVDVADSNIDLSSNNSVVYQNMEPKITQIENNEIDSLKKSEESFEKFDKEFNELIPEKDIIDDELLDEIDSLSLDKTQRIVISDIPDVDDVDLPVIKSLPKEEEDIWKF